MTEYLWINFEAWALVATTGIMLRHATQCSIEPKMLALRTSLVDSKFERRAYSMTLNQTNHNKPQQNRSDQIRSNTSDHIRSDHIPYHIIL